MYTPTPQACTPYTECGPIPFLSEGQYLNMGPKRIKSSSEEVQLARRSVLGDGTCGGGHWERVSIYTSMVITTRLVWFMEVGSHRAPIRRGSGCLKEGSRGVSAHGGHGRIYKRETACVKAEAAARAAPTLAFQWARVSSWCDTTHHT